MISLSKFHKERQFPKVVALLLLLLLLAIGAVPGYLAGRWQWQVPPPVTSLKQLKQLRHQGLTLSGWQNIEQREQNIGGRKWSLQVVKKQNSQTSAILLLLPQNGPRNQPEVEWTEIKGWQQWDVAQERSAQLSVKQAKAQVVKVNAIFFRAVTKQQTFAVLQWYALPDGGDPSPLHWFLADQLAQLRKTRTPWVAVNILIPMEPLGQVETMWKEAKFIGEQVQAALMAGPL